MTLHKPSRPCPRDLALFVLAAFFMLVPGAGAESPATIVVHWKDGPNSPAAVSGNARTGVRVLRNFPNLGWQVIELPAGLIPDAAVRLYKSLDGVLAAELDSKVPAHRGQFPAVDPARRAATLASSILSAPPGITPNDPMVSKQWYLKTIQAPQAWATTAGSTNVVVAILDTGIDYNHPDLAQNMWRNPGETGLDASGHDKATNGIDDDGDGYIDDVYGVDVTTGSGDPMDTGFSWPPNVPEDAPFYHGTFIAGIVGAVGNNGTGIAGLNWSVRMMAIKVFTGNAADPGISYLQFSTAIAAWDYMIGMKRRGVNLRVTTDGMGSTATFPALREVVATAVAEGVLPVVGAGSDSLNADSDGRADGQFYNTPLLAVAVSGQNDTLLSASDIGPSTVHLAAPGENMFSTYRGGGYIGDWWGTSQSSALVAATAALLLSFRPDLSVDDLKGAILGSVDQSASFRGKLISGGRLNVARALQTVATANPAAIVVTALPAGPRANPTSPIEIHFNRPMNTASVEQALRISPRIAGHLEWESGNRSFKVVHDTPFDRAATYSVRILGTAQDETGGTLDGNFNRVREDSPTDDFIFRFHFPILNDDFADATDLSGPTGSANGTTRSTTFEWNRHEPIPSSFFDPNTFLYLGSVWYRWTPAAPATWYTFDLTTGTSFDSCIAVYRGDSPARLVSVAENDNYGGHLSSRVSFPADPTVRYSITVLARNGTSAGASGPLKLTWYPTPAPAFSRAGFSPTAAAPASTVTLTGTNWSGATAVLFGGVSASFTHAAGSDADLRLTAIVPADARSGPVTVVTPHGSVASTTSFRVLPPPLRASAAPGGAIEISWPAVNPDFVLESSATLLGAASTWETVDAPPISANGRTKVVTAAPVWAQRFFRLRGSL